MQQSVAMNLKKILAALVFVTPAFGAGGTVHFSVVMPGATDDEMLAAIAIKETGNNPLARGRCGERTNVQFMRRTWMQYSHVPLAMAARHPDEVDRVARAYLADIRRGLRKRGLSESPYFIAASWNAGLNWTYIPRRSQDYAECVENLVAMLRADRKDDAHPMSTPEQQAIVPELPQILVGSERFQSASGPSNRIAETQTYPAKNPVAFFGSVSGN